MEKIKIKFEVPGLPVALPRARAYRIRGTDRIGHYTPKHATEFKDLVRMEAWNSFNNLTERDKLPLTGPVAVGIVFIFPRPKNKIWKTKPMHIEPKPSRPDLDNLDKMVLDALNDVIIKDDSQVVFKVSYKLISNNKVPAKTIIVIMPADADPLLFSDPENPL